MKRKVIILPPLLAVALIIASSCAKSTSDFSPRIRTNFGKNWQFRYDDEESTWQEINLPHTARLEPLVVNDQWQGTVFYRKAFEMEDVSGKKIFLYFGGIMHEADVWLNGQHLRYHAGGYLPFEVDLTDAILPGKSNLLEVKVNNEDNPDIPPGKPLRELDFNYYGGIYRNAYLIITNEVHISSAIEANKPGSGGLLVRFENISESSATCKIQVHALNESKTNRQIHFEAALKSPEGQVVKVVSEKSPVRSETEIELSKEFRLTDPHLWSPDSPALYDLQITLFADDEPVDKLSEQTGIRKIVLGENGFLLNDKKFFIRGTNRHQEYPWVGYALSDEAQYRDAVKIKNAGFDFVRLSHYPQAEAFMKACDELGLMVMNCLPGWQFMGGKEFIANSLQNCRDMIRRDRNHPSVVFWEISINETIMPDEFIEEANLILKTELPFSGIYSAGWMDHPAYDLFIPARQHGQPPDYWNFYKEGKRSVFIAEYGDWEYYAQNAGFSQTEFSDLREEERSSRQLREHGEKRLLQQSLNFQEATNSNRKGTGTIGDANWLMFDYNRGYANDLEASGIADIFRIPKFSYYFYQSQRSPYIIPGRGIASGPMVRIASYWKENSPVSLKIYSNCERVELFLNEQPVSGQDLLRDQYSSHLPYPPFVFNMKNFEPGTLRAVGYINGRPVAEHVVKTPQKATALHLEADLSSVPINSNYPDIVFVYASVIDENGTLIPDAENLITFHVDGDAVITGENPSPAKSGIAAILLRTEQHQHPITITATAMQLINAELTLSPVHQSAKD